MKNNNKSESSLRSFTTLAIVIASSLVLASCGGGESTGSTTTDSLSADAPTASAQAVARGTVPAGWAARVPAKKTDYIKPIDEKTHITTRFGIVHPSRITVYIKKSTAENSYSPGSTELEKFIKINSWELSSWLPDDGIYSIDIKSSDTDSLETAVQKLRNENYIEGVSLVRAPDLNSIIISDPIYTEGSYKYNWNFRDIKLKSAWDQLENINPQQKTPIGIIDSGFTLSHEDNPIDSIVFDAGGDNSKDHGMHVSGIIGAKKNTLGSLGIAWDRSSFMMHAANINGNYSEENFIFALKALLDKNTRVINVSMGATKDYSIWNTLRYWTPSAMKSLSDAVAAARNERFMLDRAKNIIEKSERDKKTSVLLIQASGNNGQYTFPNSIQKYTSDLTGIFATGASKLMDDKNISDFYRARTIVVGAYIHRANSSKEVAPYTNLPDINEYSDYGFVMAPGGGASGEPEENPEIYSTLNSGTSSYGFMNGTSMAAPHVTGVAGLILKANSKLTATDIKKIILTTADTNFGTPYTDHPAAGDGYDGHRYINASAAVKMALQLKVIESCGFVSSPSIVGQLGPYYTATSGQKLQFTTTPAPKTGYPFGSYNWTTSDSSATLVNNGGSLADFVLNTAGTTTVTVTPVLTDGTVCTSSAATAQVNVQAVSVPAPSVSIEMSQTGLGFAGATGIGSYDYLSSLTSGIGKPAVKFNGGKFIVPNNQNMQFTDGATFDVWLRLDSMTGMDGWGNTGTNGNYAGAIIAKSHDRTGGALMVNGFGDTWVATYDPTWEKENCTRFFSASVPNGVWFRSTITLSPTTGMKGYTNKTLSWACQPSNMSFATMNSQDLYIGRFSDYWFPIPGAIADIKIYKSALTAAQISQLN